MKSLIKKLSLLLVSLTLIACQGLDVSTDNDDSEDDLPFSLADLTERILFSDDLLKRDVQGGFILKFGEEGSLLKQIGFEQNNDDEVLVGDYNWILNSDSQLEVTYPGSITCTTTKIEDTNDAFDSKVSCSGGTPDNTKIEDELIKPLSLGTSDFSGQSITITLADGTTEILDFDDNTDGSFTFTKGSDAPQNGTYLTSPTYVNVVEIDHTYDETYSLYVLASGDLSEGTLLDLRFDNDADNLDDLISVRIYTIESEGVWTVEEEFDNVDVDE